MAVEILRVEETALKPIVTVACESEDELSALVVTGWSSLSTSYLCDSTDGVSKYRLSPSGDWCLEEKAPNASEEVGG